MILNTAVKGHDYSYRVSENLKEIKYRNSI